MTTQVRVSLDLLIEKGDAAKILEHLQKPEVSKQINDFVAYVVLADENKTQIFRTLGGHAHTCEPDDNTQCATCRQLARRWPNAQYPRSLQ